MEVYCSFTVHESTDVEFVKEKIVTAFAESDVEIDSEEILFEYEVYLLLMKDSYFETFEQIQNVLDSLMRVSKELESEFSVFKIPDFDIVQTCC